MERHWKRAAAVAAAALCVGGSAIPSVKAPASAGEGVTRQLSAGEVYEHAIELEAGRWFEVEAEQLQGNVTLELVDPEGHSIAESDLPGKPWIDETLVAITRAGGVHSLKVRATTGSPARFRLAVPRVRLASRQDGDLMAAIALRGEALGLKDLETEEDVRESIRRLERARVLMAEVDAPSWLARVLRELGDCHASQGAGEVAEQAYSQAVAFAREADDARVLSRVLNNFADLLTNRGDRTTAEPMYDEALALARSVVDRKLEALSHNNLGVLHFYQGDLERSVGSFEEALRLRGLAGDTDGSANTISNLGAVYTALGRFTDALALSEQALALARRIEDVGQEMKVLNNRGVLHKNTGELRAAIDDYQAALAFAERLGDRRWEATIGRNIGALYYVLRQERRAFEYLERALAAAEVAQSPTDEIWALLTIGDLLLEAGEPEAESYFRRARTRSEEAGNRSALGHSLHRLGRGALESGESVAAERLLEDALDVFEGTSDRLGQLSTHRDLGRAAVDLGAAGRGAEHFRSALALARLAGDPREEALTRAQLAHLLVDQGMLEEARHEVSLALATMESLRRGVVLPDVRAGLLSRSQADFALLIDILERLERTYPGQGYAEQAFAVSEKSRARSLIEILTESEANLAEDLEPALQRRRSDLTGRLTTAQRRLTQALGKSEIDVRVTDELKAEVLRLNREREELDREARLASSQWARLVYPQPITSSEAQQLLAADQALVSFVLGDSASFAFVVTREATAVQRLASERELVGKIETIRRQLETPGRRGLGRLRQEAADLYLELVAPIEGQLEGKSHLLIAADGPLHYLPFEALVPAEVALSSEEYLISKWAVSYVPSASTLRTLEARRQATDLDFEFDFQLAAFADPSLPAAEGESGGPVLRGLSDGTPWRWRSLAGARSEVRAISGLFDSSEVRVYLGAEASEGRFRQEPAVRQARYLHLASHAVVDNSEPALSSLLLTADDEGYDDGLLQTHEIYSFDIRAELVVLSGCETALGKAVRGEGLLGLTRAFLYAGAAAVSVSLWPVEDEATAVLMENFYGQLVAGAGAPQALRQAKLEQIAGQTKAHPYYWAPFVVIGSPS